MLNSPLSYSDPPGQYGEAAFLGIAIWTWVAIAASTAIVILASQALVNDYQNSLADQAPVPLPTNTGSGTTAINDGPSPEWRDSGFGPPILSLSDNFQYSPPNIDLNGETSQAELASETGNYDTLPSLYANAPNQDFRGFWGGLNYLWTGGIVDGFHYNRNGEAFGLAPTMGIVNVDKGGLNLVKGISSLWKGLRGWRSALKGGVNFLIRGGKTFRQYKAARGGTQTLREITTSTGVQRISTEFHHFFISQRMQRAFNLPNWMVNNRLNVWKLNTIQHSLLDSFRYNFLRAGFKSDVGWFGKYNWFTKF